MTKNEFQSSLGRLSAGEDLAQEEMAAVIDLIMRGQCADPEIALLLTALLAKGETVEEIAGAAQAMREHMTPIRHARSGVVDTCGTGGDASGTFNISTAAAIIAAAAGVPVAKHGNRSITSKSGSADVLAALGVNVEAPVATVENCLEELGICFCFAPHLHPAMKHVAPVRKQLGFPTVFNLLGPLCNPASAPFQVLGVGKPELQDKIASALARLGSQHAVVVTGEDGLDEVTLGGATRVIEIRDCDASLLRWDPADFGFSPAGRECMLVGGPQESAALIHRLLSGERGPCRDVAVVNAAAALWTAGIDSSLVACAQRCAEAIDSAASMDLLKRWQELSRRT